MRHDEYFSGNSVLLVEDDAFAAKKIAEQLEKLGYVDVLLARSLTEATETASNVELDAAVLDVNLPGGIRTIELGWSLATQGVPVVFISGYNPDQMAQAVRGFEFMEKPLSLSRLKAALQRAALRVSTSGYKVSDKKMAGQRARQ